MATNLKAETFSLMEKRASTEAEMNAIIAQLSAPGGPGISGNLVDAEVFYSLATSRNLHKRFRKATLFYDRVIKNTTD